MGIAILLKRIYNKLKYSCQLLYMEVNMRKKEAKIQTAEPEEKKIKGKPGRKPMSLEEKLAARKIRAAQKEKANNLKPDVIIQYQDRETDLTALVEAAKAAFHEEKKRALITDLKLYIKPEEHMAYYVINESYTGKTPF